MKTKLLTLALLLLATLAAQADVAINESNFPDAKFRSFLLSLYPHGYISSYQLNSCTSLNCTYENISELTGIKYFVGLQELRCYNNRISSLDVSGMTNLTYLDCDANGMV
jgi:Leucine-rich repeat (LRR) protein